MTALPDIRLDGVYYGVARLKAPWAVVLPASSDSYFYFLRHGDAWFEPTEGQPATVHVAEGSVVTISRGQGHVWRSSPQAPLAKASGRFVFGPVDPALPLSDGETEMIVGVAPRGAEPLVTHLTSALPPYLHIAPDQHALLAHLRSLVELVLYEMRNSATLIDTQSVIRRLSEIITIDCARFALTRTNRADPSWLAAMTDPVINRALNAVHAGPEKSWTVESLAKEIGIGRSAFAERFKYAVGEGPAHYLLRVRMQRAAVFIRGGGRSLQDVATAVGYRSEAAFSRAFVRHMGMTPGRYRARVRAEQSAMLNGPASGN